MGKASSFVFCHLSPSGINITGMSSLIGYFRPQSVQINHDSLYNFKLPSFSRTQAGHRNISSNSLLTIMSSMRGVYPHSTPRFYHRHLYGSGVGIPSVPGPYSNTACHGK